ncbi:F0F1 ATP synthase subunit B [Streptomyces deserti]
MELIPVDVGPLNPRVQEMLVAAVLFAACYLVLTRLLRRINRVLAAREQATSGVGRHAEEVRAQAEATREETQALLAEARHDAAGVRQRAQEQGAALIAAARADGVRERDELLAGAGPRLEAERMAAEAELRVYVSELAAELASRVVGEPISPASRRPAADTR